MTPPKVNIVRPRYRSSWFTKAQADAYYRDPYRVREIQIHWWGSPSTKPTHNGIVNYIAGKTGGSTNYVVSAGRVTLMVDDKDCALTTQGGNPYGLKFECSPYGTDADYRAIGWLVAKKWKKYGKKLPLVPHKKYWATACPGTLSLARIEREANKWIASWKVKEEDMLTAEQYNIIRRFYLGAPPSKEQLANNVGKVTTTEMIRRLKDSPKYTAEIKRVKEGGGVREHMPTKIREVYRD